MLFDLRGRGRRTTVRGVYLALAVLIGGGLILFGVGTGVGGGGLLNAFGGGGGNQRQAVSSQERHAEKAVKAHPNSAAAWSALIQARWEAAKGSDFNTAKGAFTKAGMRELTNIGQDWKRYMALTSHPDPLLATLVAGAAAFSGQYANAAKVWEIVTASEATNPHAFECLAVTSYAASQTRKGDLAATKALSLLPKASQVNIKNVLKAAKTSPKTAQQLAHQC